MYTYNVKVKRVVDGDTVIVDIDLGFSTWVKNIWLRLDRVDAYETRLGKNTDEKQKALGIEAREWLTKKVEDAHEIIVTTTRTGKNNPLSMAAPLA